jgi:preprotein translocase subunit SecE
VARDRKRAKQRQQRRPQRAPAPTHSELQRADVPGALEHASGDVDEFDAALIRGAGGVPAPPPDAPIAPEDANGADTDLGADPDSDLDADALELAPAGGNGGRGGRGNGIALDSGDAEAALPSDRPDAVPRERRQSLPRRAVGFLRASWAELQRVQWPNRTQVSQATAVVLGFVAIAGAYLGAADWLAQKIVNLIL